MMNRIWSRHVGKAAIGFGAIAASIYMMMINVTLAQIETLSGHTPFDMRPVGYGPSDAAALLEALGVDGRAYYLSHQISLDTFYPAALALALISAICWFGQGVQNHSLVRLGIILSGGAALFDYAENLGIVAMILTWPDLSDMLVYATSTATIIKSGLTTLAVLQMLLIAFLWVRRSKSMLRA